jgi:hypothetical protein
VGTENVYILSSSIACDGNFNVETSQSNLILDEYFTLNCFRLARRCIQKCGLNDDDTHDEFSIMHNEFLSERFFGRFY